MRATFTLAFISIFAVMLSGQNTVGLLSYDPMNTFEGYNLIYPHNQPNVYLLDMCGEVVHVWDDDIDFRPGNTAYILPNGNLVRAKRPSAVAGNPIWAGGGGAIVEMRDWDNNLLWSFEKNDSLERLHHDITITQAGTILMIVWENITKEAAIDMGRDTALLADGELWPDYILEVDPELDSIIWEWHVTDHLIQDYDSTKTNFGVVSEHPELVDLNWDTSNGADDWMHSNAIGYNSLRRQIILSVPTFNEVWVIDHTTTTQEAAGNFGGFSGVGGDLMYRWGNPATYRRGDSTDQRLYFQHDAHWADQFINFSNPLFEKMVVYNNRVGGNHSEVTYWTDPWDMYTWSYEMTGDTWGPSEADYIYTHPDTSLTFSTGLSSVQALENGNLLVCAGRFGYMYELTPDEEIVWEYRTPIRAGAFVQQGDSLAANNNLTFRINRYPLDFDAFTGRDLSPQGYLELNPNLDYCPFLLPTEEPDYGYELILYPNPATSFLTIEWNRNEEMFIEFVDITGRKIHQLSDYGNRIYTDISMLNEGIYFVSINGEVVRKIVINR